MKSYSEIEVFTPHELLILEETIRLVNSLPEDPGWNVRCHELARAVHQANSMLRANRPVATVVDGRFGGVEHSWIQIDRGMKQIILDVYAVGSLPMVQLIDFNGSFGLTGTRRYIEGTPRTDIDDQKIQQLLLAFSAPK